MNANMAFFDRTGIIESISTEFRYGKSRKVWNFRGIIFSGGLTGLSKIELIEGVHVTAINQGGAASDAGLKVDDVILEVNGRTVNSVPELQEIIGRFRPGNTINISYWRNKTKNQTKVTLRNQVNTTELITTRKDKILTDLGFELRDLTEQEKAQIGSFGIRVISIYENSTIALTNMAPNFIITSINKKSVNNISKLNKEISLLELRVSDLSNTGRVKFNQFGAAITNTAQSAKIANAQINITGLSLSNVGGAAQKAFAGLLRISYLFHSI